MSRGKKLIEGEMLNGFDRREGNAIKEMICDWSGEPIKSGDRVLAVSIGHGTPPPGITWEKDYLEVDRVV